MVDANATAGPYRAENPPFGKNHHRYVHGLRTQEVIIMRRRLSEGNELLQDLVQCPSLMELDTFMRDHLPNHSGVSYDAKTQLQATSKRI